MLIVKALRQQLFGQVSKAGWLELAEARKSTGSTSVSRLQLPSIEGEREVDFADVNDSVDLRLMKKLQLSNTDYFY